MEESKLPSVKQSVSVLDLPPEEMIGAAKKIATALADIIEKQKLYTVIQGRKHVEVGGWNTLGSMLGITSNEEYVKELDDGGYEAKVNLINMRTGIAIGGASSICGMDEKTWAKRDRYARRSMAVTRATGKAYRLNFSWILKLAGYQETPAEEMPPVDVPHETLYEHALRFADKLTDDATREKTVKFINDNSDNDENLKRMIDRMKEATK